MSNVLENKNCFIMGATGGIGRCIARKMAGKGLLLVSTHGPAIKIGPLLTIPDEALREGIQVIRESFEEIL